MPLYLAGGGGDKRKIHLMNWNILCMLKNMGGVGLRKAQETNNALLVKLAWMMICEP